MDGDSNSLSCQSWYWTVHEFSKLFRTVYDNHQQFLSEPESLKLDFHFFREDWCFLANLNSTLVIDIRIFTTVHPIEEAQRQFLGEV